MNIVFNHDKMPGQAIVNKIKEAAKLCLEREKVDSEKVEVSVTFVDAGEIKEINRVYRNKDSVTDVLSFPQYESFKNINALENIFLGDVVICTEQALLQADEFGHSKERELVYLFVHSMFHLLGYDHLEEDDKEKMRSVEEEIMSKVGIER